MVDRVRHGDAVAFEVLYDRHHRGVLSFCRHMLRSADEAEDAVQHAFIAAYNDLQRNGARDIRFKAWLYTIARNRCVSMLRARREQVSDDVDVTTDRLSDDVQQRADLQALLADIATLPEDQREALVLSEVGDLSHAEVAAVIGCEVPKVKSLVFQARSALIERRQGREMPCSEIREQLATLRGGALRRSQLRHHLAACPGCRQYREEIRRQREMLALALPVIPSLGLRNEVLAAVGLGGSGAAAGGAGVGGGVSLAAKSGLAKVGIAALVATGGAGTALVASHGGLPGSGSGSASTAPGQVSPAQGGAGGGQNGGVAGATGSTTTTDAGSTGQTTSERHSRSASGSEHGFTPVQGGSNGQRARQFALTRGKGKHLGLTKTHHTKTHVKRVHTHRHVHVKAKLTPTHPQVAPERRSTPKPETTPTHTTPTRTTPTQTTTTSTPTGTTTTGTTTESQPRAGGGDRDKDGGLISVLP